MESSGKSSKSQLNAWSNEECQLLLNIALQYKNRNAKQAYNLHPAMYYQFPPYHPAMQMANCTGTRTHPLKDPTLNPQHNNMNKNNQNFRQPKIPDDTGPFYLDLYSRLFLETDSNNTTGSRNANPYTNFLNAAYPFDMKPNKRQNENKFENFQEFCENIVNSSSQKTTKTSPKLKERMKRRKLASNICKPNQNNGINERLKNWFKRKSLDEEEEERQKVEERKNDVHMQAVFQQVKLQTQLINEGYLLMRSMLTPDSSNSYDTMPQFHENYPVPNQYQTAYHMNNSFPYTGNMMFPEQTMLGNF